MVAYLHRCPSAGVNWGLVALFILFFPLSLIVAMAWGDCVDGLEAYETASGGVPSSDGLLSVADSVSVVALPGPAEERQQTDRRLITLQRRKIPR